MSDTGSSSSSSSASVEEETTTALSVTTTTDENATGPLFDQQYEIRCETAEGDIVRVRAGLLRQSKTFMNMWKDLNMDSATEQQREDFVFSVKAVPNEVFSKVVEWMGEHVGKPDPVIEEDPATRERKWFTLTDYEKNFLEIDVEELVKLTNAGNFLDLPSLYLYACQSMAALVKDKEPEEIRNIFGLEDDMTAEEKNEIRQKNVWCNY